MDFDMHNLIPQRSFVEELEDAASGSFEAMPRKTLRDRQYGRPPLMLKPDYSGDFLNKLREPVEGKPLEASDPDNLLDFSMPSEMLKHQEQPFPRDLVDEFYELGGKPADSDRYDVLRDYHDRSWDSWDKPEMSEDARKGPVIYGPVLKLPVRRIMASFLSLILPVRFMGDKTAKLLSDLEKSKIHGNKPIKFDNVEIHRQIHEPGSGRWTFITGSENYTTTFQFIPYRTVRDVSKLHVRVSCTCPSWLFYGAQYNAVMGDYIYGKIRPKFHPPEKKDETGNFLVCKHVLKCIPIVSKFKIEMTPEEKKRILKEPKFQIETRVPEEKLKIPKELKSIGEQANIKEIVKNWDKSSAKKRKNWIMGFTDPEEVAYFAHRFPLSATHFVAEKLKQMAKEPALKRKAEQLLEEVEGKAHIPQHLKKVEERPNIKNIVEHWGVEPREHKKFVNSLNDVDELLYIGHKFPGTATQFVMDRLKAITKDPEFKAEVPEIMEGIHNLEKEIKTEVKIPTELTKYDREPLTQSNLLDWENKDEIKKKSFIENITDPDRIAYIAFKLKTIDPKSLAFIIEKFTEMAKDTDIHMKSNSEKAAKWLRFIA